MTEPAYVAATLAWCNRLRAQDGKKPLRRLPRGRRGSPESCPCGKATGWNVRRFTARRRVEWVNAPPGVTRFVRAFDAGELPEYEAKR